MVARVMTVINKRYKTSTPSFNEINFPRMAVKPAKKTAICNWMNAFFTAAKVKLKHAFDH